MRRVHPHSHTSLAEGGKIGLEAGTGPPGADGMDGPAGATSQLALSERVLSSDFTIAADHSAVVVGTLDLAGYTLTIESGGALGVI